jgi:hypothetical protein
VQVKGLYEKSDIYFDKLNIWGGAGIDPNGVTYNMIQRPDVTKVLPPNMYNIQV